MMVTPLELTDEELLVATGRGEREAFAIFYRRHRGRVLAFFMRRVGDPELSFDLTAETFAAAIASSSRFRPGHPPAVAWLFGIAHNKLIDSLRKGRVENEARRQLAMQPVIVDDDDLVEIERLAADFDAEPGILTLLTELPETQRDAVTARVLEERSYEDIARALQCSEDVVRQRVHRGLSRLRKLLEGRP